MEKQLIINSLQGNKLHVALPMLGDDSGMAKKYDSNMRDNGAKATTLLRLKENRNKRKKKKNQNPRSHAPCLCQ